MNIQDIGRKIENGGANSQGRLSAEEFNAVVAAIKANFNAIAAETTRAQSAENLNSKTITDNYKYILNQLDATRLTLDGGRADTLHGGVRIINCGGA